MIQPFDTLAVDPQGTGRRPLRPWAALNAFRKLTADKEDTLQVFEILRALSGRSLVLQYQKLLATAEGGREAYRRREFADRLQDKAWLDGFADGTVGAHYRQFIALRDLSAYGLADESRKLGEIDIDAAHPIAWYVRRQRDVHDVWHVLTGYGTDALGEACIVAFTYGQTRNIGFGFLGLAAGLELKRRCRKVPYLRAVLQGWRHGRRAHWLMGLDYEQLFAEPLVDARRRLGLARPTLYEVVPLDARNAYDYPAENVLSGMWPAQTA